MTVRCDVEGCTFEFSSSAGEGRRVAAEHRATEHPELLERRPKPAAAGRVRWTRESALAACLAYVERERMEFLTHADLARAPELPSTPTVCRLFGGTVGLTAALEAARGAGPPVNAGAPAEAAAPGEGRLDAPGPLPAPVESVLPWRYIGDPGEPPFENGWGRGRRSLPRDETLGLLAAVARLVEVAA